MGRMRRAGVHTDQSTRSSGVRVAALASRAPTDPPEVPGSTAFVGREREVRIAVEHALGDPAKVLWVHGPGGIGKTTLAREVERQVRAAGRPVVFLRMERVEARPAAVIAACAERLATAPRELATLMEARRDALIILDGFEVAPSLEGWLIDELAAAAPRGAALLVTSRDAPSHEWRGPATAARLVAQALDVWNSDESTAYLAARQVPSSRWERLVAATRGHPLALALASEDSERAMTSGDGAPDPRVFRTLLDGLLERSMQPPQRHALEALSLVPCLTQSLLEHMLDVPDAFEVFRWLSQRPYVRPTQDGLVLHDLVRDAMAADLRWRASPRADALTTRAVEFHASALEAAGSVLGAPHGQSLAWLFCQRPSIRSTFTRAAHDLYFDDLRDSDGSVIGALIERADGADARRSWEALSALQPNATVVARDAQRRPCGVWVELTLDARVELPVAVDPALPIVAADVAALELAPGQRASLQRLQLDAETLRDIGPTIQLRVAHDARVMLTTPGLAARYIAAPTDFRWARVWESRGYRALDARFQQGGRSFSVWRLDLRGTRAAEYVRAAFVGAGAVPHAPTAPSSTPPPQHVVPPSSAPPPAPRSAVDVSAMRAALGAVHDATAFGRGVVAAHVPGTSDNAARLAWFRAWLDHELAALGATRRGLKWRTALVATYLEPARSQEEVAEALDLPFRTYRDHLTRGVAELSRRLSDSITTPS